MTGAVYEDVLAADDAEAPGVGASGHDGVVPACYCLEGSLMVGESVEASK